MKLFIKSACIALVLTVIYSVIPFQASCAEIPNEVFRLHIVANSDSDCDQELKLKVRDRVLEYTSALFENAKSKEEAESLISKNLQSIADVAYDEILKNGFTYNVNAQIARMYFTTRYYENYTLPSGTYDALRITIGQGKGHNWWCVIYPSICISSSQSQDSKAKEVFDEEQYNIVKNEHYEYKFKVVELFEKLCSYF